MWLLTAAPSPLAPQPAVVVVRPGAAVSVGRKECDVALGNVFKSVSRRHVVLRDTGAGALEAADQGSMFGTHLIVSAATQQQIAQGVPVLLRHGSVVRLGVGDDCVFTVARIAVCISGIGKQQAALRDGLVATAHGLDIDVLSDVTDACTHLVVTRVQFTAKLLAALIVGAQVVTPAYIDELARTQPPSAWPAESAFRPPVAPELPADIDLAPQPRRRALFAGSLLLFANDKDAQQFAFLALAGARIETVPSGAAPAAVAAAAGVPAGRVFVFGPATEGLDARWTPALSSPHLIPKIVACAEPLSSLVPLSTVLVPVPLVRAPAKRPALVEEAPAPATAPPPAKKQRAADVPPTPQPVTVTAAPRQAAPAPAALEVAPAEDLTAFVGKRGRGPLPMADAAQMMNAEASELPRAGGSVVVFVKDLIVAPDGPPEVENSESGGVRSRNYKRFVKVWPAPMAGAAPAGSPIGSGSAGVSSGSGSHDADVRLVRAPPRVRAAEISPSPGSQPPSVPASSSSSSSPAAQDGGGVIARVKAAHPNHLASRPGGPGIATVSGAASASATAAAPAPTAPPASASVPVAPRARLFGTRRTAPA